MFARDSGRSGLQTRFRRHECKYLITEGLAARIRAYAARYMVVDPHAAAQADRSYDIKSLYLDSPDLRLFQETEDGQLNRIKLRIRSYDDHEASPLFLEIKRRFNSLVLKGRARMERAAVRALLAGSVPDTVPRAGDQLACYEEFVGWVARWLAEPMVWVKYRREAYVGTFHGDVRLTMDRNLSCAPTKLISAPVPAGAWLPVENRKVVLEIKFDESYPSWVARMIQTFALERQSYSKYGNSVRRSRLGHRTSSRNLAAAAGGMVAS